MTAPTLPILGLLILGLTSATVQEATAQEADESYATRTEVAGVTLLHRRIPESGTVAGSIYLLGGTAQTKAEKAGLEPLYLRVGRRGSEGYPGEMAARARSELGAVTGVDADLDWSSYSFRGLSSDFPRLWDIVMDGLLNPELAEEVVEVEREHAIARVRARLDRPDDRVRSLASASAFADHPYRIDPRGTEESLAAIDRTDLERFRDEKLVRSRILVVVVGGVDGGLVEEAIRTTLSDLPPGDYEWKAPPLWHAEETTITTESKNLPTNYILGYFGGPKVTAEEFPAFRLAVITLSSFVFQSIRSEGLAYAASAPLLEHAASGAGIYVSTRYPDEAVELVNDAIQIMKDGTFRRSYLRDRARNSMMSYYIRNQTPLGQVHYLARSYLYRGQLLTPDAYVQELMDIDPGIVRRMANDYFGNIQWAYLGDVSKVPESDLTWH